MPGPQCPGPTVPGLAERSRSQKREEDRGGNGTYLAAPPSPPAATVEPAAPGTIFRRRRGQGGGYQSSIRHRHRHNHRCPGANRGPELRTGGRSPGGEGTWSGPSALGQGPGDRGPRPVRAEGPRRQDDPAAAPKARQGRGHGRGRVCYCRLRPFPRGACRESAGGEEGRSRRRREATRRSGSRWPAGKRDDPASSC